MPATSIIGPRNRAISVDASILQCPCRALRALLAS
jgi:hypothetical protein